MREWERSEMNNIKCRIAGDINHDYREIYILCVCVCVSVCERI